MSIINEALKKAGFEKKILSSGILPREELTRSFEINPYKNNRLDIKIKKNKNNFFNFKTMFILWAIGCFLILASFAVIFSKNSFYNTVNPSFVLEKKINQNKVSSYNTKNSRFILSGIFLDNNRAFAIINDEVVWENGSIGNARVLKINKESVKLLSGKEEIILSNK